MTKKSDYPTADQLAAMGATLERDVCLCTADLSAWFGRPRVQAVYTRAEPAPKRAVAWPRKRTGKRIA